MTESMKARSKKKHMNWNKQSQSAPGARLEGRNSEKLNKALLVWGIHMSSTSDVQDELWSANLVCKFINL